MNRHTDSQNNQNKQHSQPQPSRTPPKDDKKQRSQHTSGQDREQRDADAVDSDVETERVDPAGVEGEGSYTATHRYNEGLAEHVRKHDIEREAEEAREALAGDEREELEQAEQRGKRGPAGTGQNSGAVRNESTSSPHQPGPSKR